ncbi:MAG TPA: hypothetical protein VMV19_00685 [Xanthobacteraceae bacterium]|nr:hypothetical protein [Xanthobacteraceae bacterium]
MISIPVAYAYLFLCLATIVVWLALFWLNQKERWRQLILSAVFSVAGPVGELFYIPDYWHPATVLSVPIFHSYISIEDFIFSFAIMGIMSALPTVVGLMPKNATIQPLSLVSILKMIAVLTIVALLSLGFWYAGLNSIFATSLAMLIATCFLLWSTKRILLLRISFVSACLMLLMMFIIYWIAFGIISDSESILKTTWSLYGTSLGVQLLDVPLSELVWAFCFGAFFSVLFVFDNVRLPQGFDR